MIENKKNNRWKTVAIIFITLFILENLFFAWALWYNAKETDLVNTCLYDVCEEYPQAEYEAKICTCYEYDVLGNYVIAKQEYMK